MKDSAEHMATLLKFRVDQGRELLAEDIKQLEIQMTGIEARIARLTRNFNAYEAAYAEHIGPRQFLGDAD